MDNKNKTKFNQWGQLLRCKTLTGNQRVILGIILNFHNIDGWDFTPLSVLEENSGFTKPTVIKNVNVLVKKGLLKKLINKSRQTNGTAPNDYIPIYDNILNLLKSQVSNFFTLNPQEELKNFTLKELKNFTQEEKKKEKNKASIYYNNNNLSTRRYMVYSENENNQITNTDMKNQITNNPENGQPINDLQVFDFSDDCENPNSLEVFAPERDKTENVADRSAAINPKDAETAYEYAMIGYNTNPKTALNSPKTAGATEIAHSEVLSMQVDSYSTETKKTPQGRNKEGNLEMDTAAEDTQIPNNGENTAPTTNTLSMEETQRIMSQALQTVLKNRKHTAADTQNAPINDRGEEITPQSDNYTTAAEKTPQGAKNSGMAADTAATKPIFNTIRTSAEWKVRHDNDSCWEETFEHAAEGLENPLEAEIRTLLNQVYKDWQNHTAAINTKMINDMKVYAERRYGIILASKEKKDTVNYYIPRHDAVPTSEEIEKLSVCHISKNMDILNRLSAGCKYVNTVILALNKAIEFTQIHRIATAQSYECVSNAMATIDQNPAMSDKKIKYITDLATHLCDMLEKVG